MCVCRGSVLWSLEPLCVCVRGVTASVGPGACVRVCVCVRGVAASAGPGAHVCVSGEWPRLRGQTCPVLPATATVIGNVRGSGIALHVS